MFSRVVRPETEKLTISNGDWLLVKKRLNHGERTEAFARRYNPTGDVNLLTVETALLTAYLIDWSLMGLDDKPLVIRGQPLNVVDAALNSLAPEDVVEIREAIDQHVRRMAAERAAEKNGQDGSINAPAISPSPSDVAGASSGSVN